MSVPIEIWSHVNGRAARVSDRGQLVTAPLAFSTFYTSTITVANTPVNLITPTSGREFVITAIVISGDRSIGANGAVVNVYENNLGPTDGTLQTIIYQDEITKQARAIISPLNILVTQADWVNAVADDVQVRVNISGYYVEAVS